VKRDGPQVLVNEQKEPGYTTVTRDAGKCASGVWDGPQVLVNEQKEPGYTTVTRDAGKCASGVCYARLESGNKVITQKMLLMR